MVSKNMKPFIRELKAMNEDEIKEKIYSEFGSKHHIGRNKIIIESITEISPEEVQDPIIKALL